MFTEKREDEQRRLVAATNKRKGSKQPEAVQENSPSHVDHRDEGQRPKHVKTVEVRILPIVKDSLKFQPWF